MHAAMHIVQSPLM